ncbi:MAG: ParA family protein, partial [Symbiobacteriaceae bacterium]|nr:ParA family protein [Symbiobacteriaceae bacterium]
DAIRTVLSTDPSLFSVIEIDFAPMIHSIGANLDLLPADILLSELELDLGNAPKREFVLKVVVDLVKDGYDFVILDAPPSLGLLFVNVLTACSEVIVPAKAEFLDIQGVSLLFVSGLNKVRYGTNPTFRVTGILLNMLNVRLKTSREIISALGDSSNAAGVPIFETTISKAVVAVAASQAGKTIFDYSPKSKLAKEYTQLAREVMNIE